MFTDVRVDRGRRKVKVGARLIARLPGPHPYDLVVQVVAMKGPATPTVVAQGFFTAKRFMAAGDVVEFDFVIPDLPD